MTCLFVFLRKRYVRKLFFEVNAKKKTDKTQNHNFIFIFAIAERISLE